MKYDARVPQTKNSLGAKSSSRVSSSAGKQARAIQKPFAVFDIDGTLIRWQLYHAINDALAKQNLIDPEIFAKVREARMNWKRRSNHQSFHHYELEVIKAHDSAITNVSATDFKKAVQNVFDEYKDQTYTYTRDLIKELKSKNYLLFAISASQIEAVEMLANYYGFDDFAGSQYQIKDGKFTGKKFILKRGQKPVYLKRMAKKHGASFEHSIAVGDSDSDIPMLEIVENPIAFNPSAELYDYAKNKNWPIVVERKNVIYKLERQDGSYILA